MTTHLVVSHKSATRHSKRHNAAEDWSSPILVSIAKDELLFAEIANKLEACRRLVGAHDPKAQAAVVRWFAAAWKQSVTAVAHKYDLTRAQLVGRSPRVPNLPRVCASYKNAKHGLDQLRRR